jgi:hypothetical protein
MKRTTRDVRVTVPQLTAGRKAACLFAIKKPVVPFSGADAKVLYSEVTSG